MSTLDWVVLAIAVVALLAWYFSYTATRLDRLHARVEGSVSSLDAQIVRRAEAALELAHSGLVDPASSMLLAQAATDSLDESDRESVQDEVREHGVDDQRAQVESQLTETLLVILPPEVLADIRAESSSAAAQLDRLQQAGQRVQLAMRFHNDAVHSVRAVRAKPLVRLFRLAGHTTMPHVVQFDDRVPQG